MNKVKVFHLNKNDKIEFTAQELEKLLNDTYKDGYNEGYNEGTSRTFTWSQPYYSLTTSDISSVKISDNSTALLNNDESCISCSNCFAKVESEK